MNDPLNFPAEDILAAVNLLTKLKNEDVKINQIFSRKLYTNTGLDKNVTIRNASNNHDVIRKNIYFLARQTKNPVILVIQFTQRGLFTLDQKDEILDYEKDLCRAVGFYKLLIQLEPVNYERALEHLRSFENSHIAEFLETKAMEVDNVRHEPVRRSPQKLSPAKVAQVKLFPAWVCEHCTFENPEGTDNICSVCFKTKGAPRLEDSIANSPELLDENNLRPCNVCTLNNSIDLDFCNACGSPMAEAVAPLRLPETDTEDSDSD